jgi:hypothetical protein
MDTVPETVCIWLHHAKACPAYPHLELATTWTAATSGEAALRTLRAMMELNETARGLGQTLAEKSSQKKKGPLAKASGPSLGRKRPRRAAIAPGATAPQQYAFPGFEVQGFSGDFSCKKCRAFFRQQHDCHNLN